MEIKVWVVWWKGDPNVEDAPGLCSNEDDGQASVFLSSEEAEQECGAWGDSYEVRPATLTIAPPAGKGEGRGHD